MEIVLEIVVVPPLQDSTEVRGNIVFGNEKVGWWETETLCLELRGLTFLSGKGIHKRQTQPAEAWGPAQCSAQHYRISAAGQRIGT